EQRMETLAATIKTPLVVTGPDAATAKTIETEMSSMKSELQAVQSAVLDSPAKSLAMPMLKKDIENLKETTQKELKDMREEFTRTPDAIKGIVGFITASNVGLGILAFMKKSEAKG